MKDERNISSYISVLCLFYSNSIVGNTEWSLNEFVKLLCVKMFVFVVVSTFKYIHILRLCYANLFVLYCKTK